MPHVKATKPCLTCGKKIRTENSGDYCRSCRIKVMYPNCRNPECGRRFEVAYPKQYKYCPDCRRSWDTDRYKRVIHRQKNGSEVVKEGKWWDDQPIISGQLEYYFGRWWA